MSRKPDSIYKKKEPNFQVLKEIRFQSERKTAKVTRPTYRAGSSSSYALEEGQDSSRKGDGKLTVLQLLYCQSGGLGTNTGGTIMGRQRMTMLPLVHACRSLDENWKQISRRIGSRKTRASFVIDVQCVHWRMYPLLLFLVSETPMPSSVLNGNECMLVHRNCHGTKVEWGTHFATHLPLPGKTSVARRHSSVQYSPNLANCNCDMLTPHNRSYCSKFLTGKVTFHIDLVTLA